MLQLYRVATGRYAACCYNSSGSSSTALPVLQPLQTSKTICDIVTPAAKHGKLPTSTTVICGKHIEHAATSQLLQGIPILTSERYPTIDVTLPQPRFNRQTCVCCHCKAMINTHPTLLSWCSNPNSAIDYRLHSEPFILIQALRRKGAHHMAATKVATLTKETQEITTSNGTELHHS